MVEYKRSSHTVHAIKYHFVWVTKYRHKVLQGAIADRGRALIRQICKRNHVEIIKGHMDTDHVHLLVDAPPNLAPSKLMQYIKGVSSRKLQQEFPDLNKRYWGRHLWATGYFCASSGTVTDEMIKEYIKNHKDEGAEDNFGIHGIRDRLLFTASRPRHSGQTSFRSRFRSRKKCQAVWTRHHGHGIRDRLLFVPVFVPEKSARLFGYQYQNSTKTV